MSDSEKPLEKVTSLSEKKVDSQTVETLTAMLESAKKGEINSIIFIDNYHDGKVGHGWSGKPNLRMIGELENVKFNFLSQMYFPVVDNDDDRI